jgi:aminoglycoside/choline kinase family phosphotransferase
VIEDLQGVLRNSCQPGVAELREVLDEVLDGTNTSGRFTGQQTLKADKVHRLAFELDGRPRTLVVKCLTLPSAVCSGLVATRWLRAAGLHERGPALLGVAAARGAQAVWHVYEDLGDRTLDTRRPDWSRVRAAIDLIADLHSRFAEHPLLPEARLYGKDMGMSYYLTNLRDAIRAMESLRPPAVEVDVEEAALRDRLLDRLHALLAEGPDRARLMTEVGGPETLLHGDLWPRNIVAVDTADGLRTRLIDWDATGVGPPTYDISTLCYRFAADQRPRILDLYQEAIEPLGWRLPETDDLSLLLETAEVSRIANCIIWPCIEATQAQADWVFDELAERERWLDLVRPALSPT